MVQYQQRAELKISAGFDVEESSLRLLADIRAGSSACILCIRCRFGWDKISKAVMNAAYNLFPMARLPRLVIPNQPHHILQSGIDGQTIFRDDADYAVFLGWLRDAAKQFKVAVHAYVLMPTHLHLLVSPSDETGLGRMMQWVGRHYVPYFNGKYQRGGTLWQSRYKATVIDSTNYFLLCSRYIELNPVRSGLVSLAEEYPWSSYAHHAGLRSDPVIHDHPVFWALGNTPFDREAAYRALNEQGLSERELFMLREATGKGWALGSEQFKTVIAKQTNRRVSPARRGRPPKSQSVIDTRRSEE